MNGEKTISPGSRVDFELLKTDGSRIVLQLSGRLDADSTPVLWEKLKERLVVPPGAALETNVAGVEHVDSAGLAFLYMLQQGCLTPQRELLLNGLKPEYEKTLESYSMADYKAFESQQPVCESIPVEVGTAVLAKTCEVEHRVIFIGDVIAGLGYVLTHPQWLRGKEVLRIFEAAGANALPIVSLISMLLGLVIAFEAAQPMAQFGAKIYVANLIGYTMVRELGPIMTAILLAGRSGSALAAELGTMKVNEELNALETTGLDPIRFLVVQRILAFLLLTPLLTIFSMVTGVFGGVLVMLGLGFPMPLVWSQLQSSLHVKDVFFGIGKGFVFGGIVSGVACFNGLQTKSGPTAVGESTTRSVVSGIFLIVITDSIFAVLNYVLQQ
jgi:phospholipid/cholesterol/gamma-HCH transport system permease protein